MAVMQNSIIFGGVDSADFGIYIGGEGTFNAPKRDVEMISIPGRNGAFALDKGRFENIEVTYSAFNYETDLATFSANLEAFRNAICSQKGYQRLTDTFHPDEYRMATYNSGLEVKPVKYNTAAEFDIVFDCKPQRYLMSGESAIDVSSGDTLLNPTLFEARPMLEVEGYGNINIGGETVTLNDKELGNTVIADALVQNWPTRSEVTYAFDIDVSMLNEGDIITVPQVALEYSYAINDGYTNVRSSVDLPRDATGATNASGTTQKITLNAGSFAYKTAGSYDGRVWFDTSWNGPYADTYEMQRMTSVSYDGEHTITLASIGTNADELCYTRTGTKWIIPTIYGKSTKMISSVVDKAYIDLDVGEAYFVDDGTVVSLNNVTALPAVLPTLKPSVNEITFDNTVTELKVVPRWWKV